MSFSSQIKDKLCGAEAVCDACAAAELTGAADFSGGTAAGRLKITTENKNVAGRMMNELSELFGECLSETETGRGYRIMSEDRTIVETLRKCSGDICAADECCRGAYVRGAFLCGGSVNDPERSYHMEFNAAYESAAQNLRAVLHGFGIESKCTLRKGRHVVYIKEGDAIADALTLMGAGVSVTEIYNVQIEKGLRNLVNRQMNCETANTKKAVDAAARHIQAIKKLTRAGIMSSLPDTLAEIARVRLEYPEESLEELGRHLDPPLGKSGVNHRLNRIVKTAQERL